MFGVIFCLNFVLFNLLKYVVFFLNLGIESNVMVFVWVNDLIIKIFGKIGFLGKWFWKICLLIVIFFFVIMCFLGMIFLILFNNKKG